MAGVFTNIPRVTVGGDSLVSAEYANRLIDAVNALMNLQVVGANNIATVSITAGQVYLDFAKLEDRLTNPTVTANGSCSGNNITINISLDI